MPFDVHNFPAASRLDRAATRQSRRTVAIWLFGVAAMIMVMIVLGGATRLTGSGLSIMEWAPLMGALPPLSESEWRRLFALYQQIPQYTLVNQGFGLDGFKTIFWLEWTHRLWGRLIGLAFVVPLVWFWATARIEPSLVPRLILLFILGGLQGAAGWFMVASGFFPDSTAVSAYRLVVHLVLALLLYGAIVWTALSLLRPMRLGPAANPGVRLLAIGCLLLVSSTIVAGGFVAGTHAGLIYNTFPLMDGRLVPDTYAELEPFLRNFGENVATIQFDHRILASLSFVFVSLLAALGLWRDVGMSKPLAVILLAALAGQYVLGVTTLLWRVPIALATVHQAGAVLLLTAVLFAVHGVTGRHINLSAARAQSTEHREPDSGPAVP